MLMYFTLDINVNIEQYRFAIFLRGFAYAILAPTLMWALDESVPSLEQFFMGLFVFNILHMYLAGAAGYGIYTTIFSHFMNDNMTSYGQQLTLTHLDMAHFNLGEYVSHDFLHSIMMVAMKQVYGYVIWFALAPCHPSSCCATFLLSAQISAKFPAGLFMPLSILREGSKRMLHIKDESGSCLIHSHL